MKRFVGCGSDVNWKESWEKIGLDGSVSVENNVCNMKKSDCVAVYENATSRVRFDWLVMLL